MMDLEKGIEIAAKILARAVEMIFVLADKKGFNREKFVKDAFEGVAASMSYIDFEKYEVSEQAIKDFENKWESEAE